MTKQPPSRREHVELGADLLNARWALLDACRLTDTHYPRNSAPARAAQAALDAFERLRSALDNESASELPGDDWSPMIYYGDDREARAEWLAENPLDHRD
ncbi:hypothetical protein GCM10009827_084220 [Dactylosporangium maewongense]|uniref:Uncharacterized protein n=1 Tax=Dactylosporangium maewongense TaxID=634393 RepID=A0ABP4MUW3_9ACTN